MFAYDKVPNHPKTHDESYHSIHTVSFEPYLLSGFVSHSRVKELANRMRQIVEEIEKQYDHRYPSAVLSAERLIADG